MNDNYESASRSAGYSMIELVISSVLLAMMVYTVSTLSIRGGQAQEYARRLNRVTEISQELMDDVRLELVSSVRVFGNDVEGTGNLAMLDLDGVPAPLAGLRLPTVSPNDTLRTDTAGAEITGNSLFFAKLAWSDPFVCASGNDYLVDVYRWVYYYMTPEDGGPNPNHPIGLNMIRILSEPLVDAGSIDRITDPIDQAEVLLHLLDATPDANGNVHTSCQVVWRRGDLPTVTGTFRQIDPSDGSLRNNPIGGRPNPWEVLRSQPTVQGLLSYRHHSVASIYAQPSFGVGSYSLTSTANDGFPHGFEVQVVGPSSARQILIHMVVSSTSRTGFFAWSDMQVTVDARDL